MVGCRAVAVLLLALVSAVAEDAAEDAAARLYLVEGVAPAAGRLEAAAVERARAVAAGLGFAGAALLNNAASKCARSTAATTAATADPPTRRAAAPAFAGVALNYAYFLEQAGDPAAAADALDASVAAVRADGSGDRDDGLAASGVALRALSAAELPGRYARLLRRLEALAVVIVAELGANTSPGLLFHGVFLGLAARDDLELCFAAPRSSTATAAAPCRQRRVVDLDLATRPASALAGAEADVVVYLALGLSHVTYNLARCRLAPVQVVFGHGHPMSAGLGDAIDYFVSSKLYEADVANLMDGDAGRLAVLAEAAVLADVREPGLARPPPIVLPDPPRRQRASRPRAAPRASRPTPAATRRRSASPPPCPTAATGPGLRRAARLQHSKKLHPDFDASLAAVFAKAPGDALVLMLEGARTHLARWNATLGPAAAARLVFLPRMPREDLLAIVRVSDALLDTHPWGGGVTVLEALAVCTPPVVLPSRTRNAWLFEADKAVDEWARFLRNVARRTHLVPPPMVWPWAASRDAHAAQRAKDVERGYL
ncbi:hypothetical protein JL721_4404 [Aureococcus anophagefferens]|nr:hypothetical protein JL721_4404 [Aureococcus anophagefferens]